MLKHCNNKLIHIFFLWLLVSSCLHEQEVPIAINFDYSVSDNSYTTPVVITVDNNTTGADFYRWTFEGATPSTSDKKQPGVINYDKAGTYIIKLEAWNDFVRQEKEITIQIDSAVSLNFDVTILVNDFSPATVAINNKADGASTYQWTFEGGSPQTSTLKDPPHVIFETPGKHAITLKVSNGREFFSATKEIVVQPALKAEFEIVPFFKDEDYEAPLTATLLNRTQSALRYTWTSTGGIIANPNHEQTEIYFPAAGDYTVTLTAENDKETQVVQHAITVKPNRNIYILPDVKFGVSAAQNTIGSFYSTKLRKTLTSDEITSENGSLVDVIFYGINSSFSYCRFISPDSASRFAFPTIPGAIHTHIVNKMESTPLSFTPSNFDALTNGAPLNALNIEGNDTQTDFFNGSQLPRIVLFQTQDGRRGAIKIKSYVNADKLSYILADIKIQKSITD